MVNTFFIIEGGEHWFHTKEQKRFVTVHDVSYSAIFVCLAATFAAIQEGHIIRSQSDEID